MGSLTTPENAPRLQDLDDILAEYVSKSGHDAKIPGAAIVVAGRNGRIIHSSSAGTRRFDADAPFTPDTVCFIASMTKLVTSVATMQIVECGLVGLDDDLGRVVPYLSNLDVLQGFDQAGLPILVKQTKPVTLRHLLSHTSGFGYDVFDPDLIRWRKSTGGTVNANSFSAESLKIPLKFQPGEGWLYGIGLDWAGYVVETLTGQSLEDYLRLNIFKPLNMGRTTFRISEHPELESQRADIGFRAHPTGPVVLGTNYKPDATPMDCGGVGLYSTAADYAKLLGALLNDGGSILKPQTVDELLSWQLPDPTFIREQLFGEHHAIFAPEFPYNGLATYGLCGGINEEDIPGKRRARSLMWHGIANCRWWLDRETGVVAALFVQLLPAGDQIVTEMYDKLERAVYRSLQQAP